MSRETLFAMLGAVLLGAALVGGGLAVGASVTDDAVAPVTAQQPDDGAARTISVSASGQAEAQPDKALVRLAVEAAASDPNTARERVARNVSAVRSALIELGLNESQIRTAEFDIYSDERRHREGGEGTVVYRARHTLLVEVEAIDRTGAVIDAAVDAGATDIHNVQYTLSQATREALRQDALRDAMGSARTQAGTLAEEAGLTITGVNAVSTVEVHFPHARVETAALNAGHGGTDLNAGPVTVTVSVSVQYNATDA